MVRRVLPRAGEGANLRWLRNGLPGLVVRLSRVVGAAPFVFDGNRVRISRALSLYGVVFIIAINGMTIFCSLVRAQTQPEDVSYTSSITSQLVNNLYVFIRLLINVCAVIFTSDRMKTWIEVFERVQKIKTKLSNDEDKTRARDDTQTRDTIFVALSLLVLLLCGGFTLLNILDCFHITPSSLCRVACVSDIFTYLVELMIELQIMYICQHINSVFSSFNELLLQLLPTDADNERNDISPPTTPATQYHTLRQLNASYTEICELVDVMNHGHIGFTMLLAIISCAIQFINYPYWVITLILSKPILVKYLVSTIFWMIHRVIVAYLNIAPGHQIVQQVQQTQDTLNKVMGKVLLCTDDVAVQLKKLAMKMMLVKPTFSPLAMCTLSRSLLVTIIWAATTYVVIMVQFRSSELLTINHYNNITNIFK